MADFEKAIISASLQTFPDVNVSCCFFHLGQSMYRKIQSEGLQEAYNDPLDRELEIHTHMILALAFVPPQDVEKTFDDLRDEVPDDLLPIMDYFEETYVRGRPGIPGPTLT